MSEEALPMRARSNDQTRRRLTRELDGIAVRLHTEAQPPIESGGGGDFLDVAQGVEHRELAGLTTSRLVERARRLRIALARVSEGEYGFCAECGTAIPPRRLLALPDATTCVACQARLEGARAS
jgi:DnaK suppressor protein